MICELEALGHDNHLPGPIKEVWSVQNPLLFERHCPSPGRSSCTSHAEGTQKESPGRPDRQLVNAKIKKERKLRSSSWWNNKQQYTWPYNYNNSHVDDSIRAGDASVSKHNYPPAAICQT